jgi:hypothetical protein
VAIPGGGVPSCPARGSLIIPGRSVRDSYAKLSGSTINKPKRSSVGVALAKIVVTYGAKSHKQPRDCSPGIGGGSIEMLIEGGLRSVLKNAQPLILAG